MRRRPNSSSKARWVPSSPPTFPETNGGGFLNANSAHPFENPTPFSNFFEMIEILLIGSALVYMFGRWVGNTKQGWSIWAAMFILFSIGYFVAVGPSRTATR